jgi:hypothetical protein
MVGFASAFASDKLRGQVAHLLAAAVTIVVRARASEAEIAADMAAIV